MPQENCQPQVVLSKYSGNVVKIDGCCYYFSHLDENASPTHTPADVDETFTNCSSCLSYSSSSISSSDSSVSVSESSESSSESSIDWNYLFAECSSSFSESSSMSSESSLSSSFSSASSDSESSSASSESMSSSSTMPPVDCPDTCGGCPIIRLTISGFSDYVCNPDPESYALCSDLNGTFVLTRDGCSWSYSDSLRSIDITCAGDAWVLQVAGNGPSCGYEWQATNYDGCPTEGFWTDTTGPGETDCDPAQSGGQAIAEIVRI